MLKWNGEIITQDHFPDGTLKLAVNMPLFMLDIGGAITWKYESDAELFSLICLVKHVRKCCPGLALSLNLPYLPHARMDRVKDRSDVFTLKYFADIINSLHFKTVNILDPHSNVGAALIDNAHVLSPMSYIWFAVSGINRSDLALFYPDEGSCKRYSGMFNYPYLFGVKQRNWKTGEITSFDLIGDTSRFEPGTPVLIVDDICSRGGTFYHSAKKLKEAGFGPIYLYVTHCEPTILQGNLLDDDLIERVYTTDSIFFNHSHPKIEVMSCV